MWFTCANQLKGLALRICSATGAFGQCQCTLATGEKNFPSSDWTHSPRKEGLVARKWTLGAHWSQLYVAFAHKESVRCRLCGARKLCSSVFHAVFLPLWNVADLGRHRRLFLLRQPSRLESSVMQKPAVRSSPSECWWRPPADDYPSTGNPIHRGNPSQAAC